MKNRKLSLQKRCQIQFDLSCLVSFEFSILKIYTYFLYKKAYLSSFIQIEYKFAYVTAEEDDDNGEKKSNHGGVAAVASGCLVVCSKKTLIDIIYAI